MILVTCKGCDAHDLVGPGHPAVTYVPHPDDPDKDQHVITDRTALRHSHADDCEPHPETGHYPLHFEFMAGTVSATGA